MSTPLSAKFCKVRVNGAVVAVLGWTVTPEVDALDITHSESGGYADYIPGVIGAKISIDMDFDSAQYQTAVGLAAGTTVTNLILYTSDVGSAKWTFQNALVTSSPIKAEIRGKVSAPAEINAKGVFTFG